MKKEVMTNYNCYNTFFISIFLQLDEDNESLFGAWFEEVLTLGDQQVENVSSKTQASDYVDIDKSSIDPSNYSVVPETDDPEGVRFSCLFI